MAQSTAGRASSPYTHPAGVGPEGSQHSLQPPALRHCCRRLLHRSVHRPQETPQSCSGQEVHEAPPGLGAQIPLHTPLTSSRSPHSLRRSSSALCNKHSAANQRKARKAGAVPPQPPLR